MRLLKVMVGASVTGHSAAAEPVTLSHSSSLEVIAGNSIACSITLSPPTTTENSYWRSFYLPAFGVNQPFEAQRVEIGIERAVGPSGTGTQDVTVRLYRDVNGGAPLRSELALLGTATHPVPDQSRTRIILPVEGRIGEGGTLVVEVFSEDHTVGTPPSPPSGGSFYIGSNNHGETGVSYMSSNSCSLFEPTPTLGLVPGLVMHLVILVHGETTTRCYADCDISTGVGILDIFDFLCFQNAFQGEDPYACDCDVTTGTRVCDVFDFLCFQNEYAAGCP